ncbi:MAG: molybdopterin molybdotransferase MoeA [Verrucomicrobiae bacterium]|nr:molybdopterin molybdotransferase MoeA [Verrucomicrobiae bacterium]
MLSALESVREELLAGLEPVGQEVVPLVAAAGRVMAISPRARTALPPFDNSAMDGYAVRAADLGTVPVALWLRETVPAGGWPKSPVGAGETVRVFTGAPLPEGADAVVMQEDTEPDPEDPGRIRFLTPVKPWEHVRFRGEDVNLDAPLVPEGRVLDAAALALLAAAGVHEVAVFRQPLVVIRVTGDELAVAGMPLKPGQIHESNAIMLTALIRSVGGLADVTPPLPDDADALRAALETAAAGADLVVTAGGASVGDHDLVRRVITDAGGVVQDWRIAIKPGKPLFHGRLAGRPVLGVPGNPVSAFVTAVLLVLPALRRLQGMRDVLPPETPGVLAATLANPEPRRHFMRVHCDRSGRVRSAGPQASHRLASLAAANGLVDVPPGAVLAPGTTVPVIRWGSCVA